MSKNTSSENEITQQANLRRALDFVGDEIRSASVINTTSPGWTLSPTLATTTPSTALYLEIPTPVDTDTFTFPSATLTVRNHGLVQGNAVKISGTASTLPSGINNTDTYYVSATSLDTNTLQLVKSDGTTITFTTTPQNFAIRRLVLYYPAANPTGWKGQQVLYRATGNCAANSATADLSNCLVMVDSLVTQPTTPAAATAPFFTSIVGGKQATIYLNGRICNPPTLANNCTTGVTNVSVSMSAISRATLQ